MCEVSLSLSPSLFLNFVFIFLEDLFRFFYKIENVSVFSSWETVRKLEMIFSSMSNSISLFCLIAEKIFANLKTIWISLWNCEKLKCELKMWSCSLSLESHSLFGSSETVRKFEMIFSFCPILSLALCLITEKMLQKRKTILILSLKVWSFSVSPCS